MTVMIESKGCQGAHVTGHTLLCIEKIICPQRKPVSLTRTVTTLTLCRK